MLTLFDLIDNKRLSKKIKNIFSKYINSELKRKEKKIVKIYNKIVKNKYKTVLQDGGDLSDPSDFDEINIKMLMIVNKYFAYIATNFLKKIFVNTDDGTSIIPRLVTDLNNFIESKPDQIGEKITIKEYTEDNTAELIRINQDENKQLNINFDELIEYYTILVDGIINPNQSQVSASIIQNAARRSNKRKKGMSIMNEKVELIKNLQRTIKNILNEVKGLLNTIKNNTGISGFKTTKDKDNVNIIIITLDILINSMDIYTTKFSSLFGTIETTIMERELSSRDEEIKQLKENIKQLNDKLDYLQKQGYPRGQFSSTPRSTRYLPQSQQYPTRSKRYLPQYPTQSQQYPLRERKLREQRSSTQRRPKYRSTFGGKKKIIKKI